MLCHRGGEAQGKGFMKLVAGEVKHKKLIYRVCWR